VSSVKDLNGSCSHRQEPIGAVCPEHGTGAALVLPFCNTEAMQLHLDEIATRVTAGAHAILILDQAGWHGAKDLKVPSNLSLVPLPPRAPELNSRKYLAVHAAELALQPHLQILRRYRRSLLLRPEHAHGSTVEDHVHRPPRLGRCRSLIVRIGIRHAVVARRVNARLHRNCACDCPSSRRPGPARPARPAHFEPRDEARQLPAF
jgi:hypothetical protein